MPFSSEKPRSSLDEEAMVFRCENQQLLGIVHHADTVSDVGVLIVTGGPQYRIGSHRQFLLLARAFAAAGYPSFRFDHRGTGDSDGTFLGFERIGSDITVAITAFLERAPGVERVVLWGLCDAASAVLLYAPSDPRVAGLVLLNPWVRSVESEGRAMVKHYYGRRLLEWAFWRKLLSGRINLAVAPRDFSKSLWRWLCATMSRAGRRAGTSERPLPARMAQSLDAFEGPVGLFISGRDLTAREFDDAAADPLWRRLLAEDRIERHDLPAADHTFSRRVWREEVASSTLVWLDNFKI